MSRIRVGSYRLIILLVVVAWLINIGIGMHIGGHDSTFNSVDENDLFSLPSEPINDRTQITQTQTPRRVKKVLEEEDIIEIDPTPQLHGTKTEQVKYGERPHPTRTAVVSRTRRNSPLVRVPSRLAMFPFLAVKKAVDAMNPTNYVSDKNLTMSTEAPAIEERLEPVNAPSNSIKTKANVTANDLKVFHSTVLYGVMKACRNVAESYKNMLKNVDRSVNAKLRLVHSRLPTQSGQNSKLRGLFGRIRKCYKKIPTASQHEASLKPENVVVHGRRNSPTIQAIHAKLDEEGRRMRMAAQLDVIPNSENLVKFEQLALQVISNLCEMDENIQIEHNRIGGLLLSALDSASTVPKATAHQKEMEELIDKTEECLKFQAK